MAERKYSPPHSRKQNVLDQAVYSVMDNMLPNGGFIVLYIEDGTSELNVASNIDAPEVQKLLNEASKQIGLLNNTPNN